MGMFRFSSKAALNKKQVIFIAMMAVAVAPLFLTLGCQDDQADYDREEALSAMFETLFHAQSLSETSSVSTEISMTREDLDRLASDVERDKLALNQQIDILERASDDGAPQIRQLADSLIANAEAVEDGRENLHRIMAEGRALTRLFTHRFGRELDAALVTSLDEQFHEVISQYEGSSDVRKKDFIRYHHMYNMLSSMRLAAARLGAASTFDIPPDLVGVAHEDFNSDVQRLRNSIEYLSENGGPNTDQDTLLLSWQFVTSNTDDGSIFDALETRLELSYKERELAAANSEIVRELSERLHERARSLQESR